MSILTWTIRRRRIVAGTLCAPLFACAPRQFDRDLRAGRWVDAARTFAADSSLMNDERALYEAAVLYSSPGRPTFDPARGQELLRRSLARFPGGQYANAAADRLALVQALIATRDSAATRERAIETRIAVLTADAQRLRAGLDSVQAQSDGLRRNAAHVESELRERDEQLRALRLELKQLKAIDLKPRGPPRPP